MRRVGADVVSATAERHSSGVFATRIVIRGSASATHWDDERCLSVRSLKHDQQTIAKRVTMKPGLEFEKLQKLFAIPLFQGACQFLERGRSPLLNIFALHGIDSREQADERACPDRKPPRTPVESRIRKP